MRGVWTEGVPTGPFTTVEFGSGHVFSCVRCMFCASHGYPNDDTHLSTSRLPHGTLRFGVVAVECAVSGQYFFHFPHVRHLAVDDDDEAQSGGPAAAGHRGSAAALEACLPKPKPTADEERRDSKTVNEFFSMSDDVANRVGRCLRFLPTTTDFGSEVVVNNEAVVFIPGFNTPLDYACSRLGQLLALAKLPARFKPIVLSWPGGKAISYLSALKVASEPQTASTLLSLITALHTHGITTIHVLAHSMGARLLLHAIPILRMAPLFASGAVRIPNVVLLAPDFPLETFVEHSHTHTRRAWSDGDAVWRQARQAIALFGDAWPMAAVGDAKGGGRRRDGGAVVLLCRRSFVRAVAIARPALGRAVGGVRSRRRHRHDLDAGRSAGGRPQPRSQHTDAPHPLCDQSARRRRSRRAVDNGKARGGAIEPAALPGRLRGHLPLLLERAR